MGKNEIFSLSNTGNILFTSISNDDSIIKNHINMYTDLEQNTAEYYYDNGNLFLEAKFKNSIIDGIARYYFESGALQEERHYKNGLRNGNLQFLVESATISAVGGFIGIIFGFFMTLLLSAKLHIPFTFDVKIATVSFIFSGFIFLLCFVFQKYLLIYHKYYAYVLILQQSALMLPYNQHLHSKIPL